ncbi:MAG: hypothetical protein DWQ11_18780 [Proteobacteria bacterium]|nr:MAG: hypothetical protein DWQ11_18780 [Pseudomonadota bacterium]
MSMISMKQEPPAKAEGDTTCCAQGEQPLYPYGLSLSLNSESMQKLGLSFDSLTIGQKMTLTAVIEVTSVSAYKEQEGTEANASMQITDMELAPAKEQTREQRLYANSTMNA